jgi:hypothetical protein
VTGDPAAGSVFVMAARAGRGNACGTGRGAPHGGGRGPPPERGTHPGILSVFLDDVDRQEWRDLRVSLELEGVVRRFFTGAAARPVAAASTTRMEMFGAAPPMPCRAVGENCASAIPATRPHLACSPCPNYYLRLSKLAGSNCTAL